MDGNLNTRARRTFRTQYIVYASERTVAVIIYATFYRVELPTCEKHTRMDVVARPVSRKTLRRACKLFRPHRALHATGFRLIV